MTLTGKRPISPFGFPAQDVLRESPAARARSLITGWLQRLRQDSGLQRRVRRTVVELSRLDSRTLRDIGLDRSEILRAAQDAESRTIGRGRHYRQ
jgi:uncharacterized protein YjiS (DUF1127 family)